MMILAICSVWTSPIIYQTKVDIVNGARLLFAFDSCFCDAIEDATNICLASVQSNINKIYDNNCLHGTNECHSTQIGLFWSNAMENWIILNVILME